MGDTSGPSMRAIPPARGNAALRAAGLAAALAFRAIPKGWRYRTAVVAARWLEPLIARTNAYAERRRQNTDGLREASLHLLLLMLTRHGTTFDPLLRVDGAEHLGAPGSQATLLVAPHAMLSTFISRYLYDRGYDPLYIAGDTVFPVPGTRHRARFLPPSPTILLAARRAFKERVLVGTMIDRGEVGRRSAPFPTGGGTLLVSDALVHLALRSGARVVFLVGYLEGSSRIVCRLGRPSPACASAADVVAEFVAFVDAALWAGASRPPGAAPRSAPVPCPDHRDDGAAG